MGTEEDNWNWGGHFPWTSRTSHLEDDQKKKLWGVVIFSVAGAAAAAFAVLQLRRTIGTINAQLSGAQSQSQSSRGSFRSTFHEDAARNRRVGEESQSQSSRGSFGSTFHEDVARNRRMGEESRYQSSRGSFGSMFHENAGGTCRKWNNEFEEDMQRVERIRRVYMILRLDRNKHQRYTKQQREYDNGAHEHKSDWYYNSENYYRDKWNHYRRAMPSTPSQPLSHHYSVLGLDWSRSTPYTDVEIKRAFRAKAKAFHPDRNPDNREAAEAKFKEVLMAYEAINEERKKNPRGFC